MYTHEKSLNNQAMPLVIDTTYQSNLVEYFVDGILILTYQGNKIYANSRGEKICNYFNLGKCNPNLIPDEILHPCQEFVKHCILHSQETTTIYESEITNQDFSLFRLRIQGLKLDNTDHFYLMVIVEDRYQYLQNLVKFEARKYGLTRSEEQVWLFRCAKYSYKQIADKLHISLNTVKKHIKNIHAKREAAIEFE
jgi:DNA-binding CsgD family transcriptional regulator